MQFTGIDMNNNRIKTAKYKLSQHRVQGERSPLSIFQVAKLMDTINKANDQEEVNRNPIFFSMN